MGPDGESSRTFSMLDDDDEDDSEDFDDDEILSLGPSPNGPFGLRISELLDREAGETDGPPQEGEEDEQDDEEAEDEREKVQVLATFYYEGEKYVVATPLEPVLIIGSPVVRGEAAETAKSQLRVGSDLDVVISLPGTGGLVSEMKVCTCVCECVCLVLGLFLVAVYKEMSEYEHGLREGCHILSLHCDGCRI